MKALHKLGVITTASIALAMVSQAQTWKPLAKPAPVAIHFAMLMTDGTVMAHQMPDGTSGSFNWWKLTPSNTGSYSSGTWTKVAPSTGYGPLWCGSAVLNDGRVLVMGGEYDFNLNTIWDNTCKIYDPRTNLWTNLTPPFPMGTMGDTQTTVLDDGKVMVACIINKQTAIFDPATNKFTVLANPTKDDRNDEEGWSKLPDGSVITANVLAAPGSQRFIPSSGLWVSAGTVPVMLPQASTQEIGPSLLRPDGTVWFTGGLSETAVYNVASGTWTKGPTFPNGDGIPDGPGVVLTNGKCLVAASPGFGGVTPTRFYEFNGSTLTQVAAPSGADNSNCFMYNFLMLPTGEVLATDINQSTMWLYTSTGGPNAAWRPNITSVPGLIGTNQTYKISGTQFNGLTECSNYGDDVNNATNYPLVRVTNVLTGHVTYAKTSGHSTRAVATGNATVSTTFRLPATTEKGTSKIEVVANGIASNPVTVVISDGNPGPTGFTVSYGTQSSGNLASLQNQDFDSLQVNSTVYNTYGQQAGVTMTFTNFAPSQLVFTDSSGNGTTDTVYMFNQLTKKWDAIQSFQGSATVKTRTVDFLAKGIDTSKYADSTGKVQAMIRSYAATNKTQFTLSLDQVQLL